MKTRLVVGMFSIGMIVFGAAFGQPYPNKPIRIVTTGIGSSSDHASRLIGQGIAGPLGQPVVVDNRPGNLTGEMVAKSPPDGYTLLLDGASFWLAPLIQQMPYDPVKDFAPISLLVGAPFILVLSPTMSVNSLDEFIALAKSKPGAFNYASGSSGGSGHLASELFNSMAGVKIVRVAYKSSILAFPDLFSGQVHMVIDNPATIMPFIKSGKLKGLAVTSLKPTALVPGVPTVAASVPGFEIRSATSIFAPAKTPEAVIKRLNQEIVRFLNQAEVKDKLFSTGIEVIGSSPEELAATIKSDMIRVGKVIKDANIKAD